MATINEILGTIGQSGALASRRPKLPVHPTRLPSFNNEIMKIGGLAGGRVYELYAPFSAGKSTLKQIFYADYQAEGFVAADMDAEAAAQTETDIENKKSWMESLGINTEELIMPNFSSAEDCFETTKRLIVAGVNIIGIDTVAVLQPENMAFRLEESANMKEKLDLAMVLTIGFNGLVGGFTLRPLDAPQKIDKSRAGWKTRNYIPIPQERLQFLAQHGVTVSDPYFHKLWYYDCAIIGVNHAKDMIGVLYGDPTYTPGGKSLGFHSSVRIGMTKPVSSKEKVKMGDYEVPLYRKTRITAPKNKLAAPFGEMSLRIYQNGQVEEDVPFFVIAERKGLIEITGRNVRFLVGEDKDKMMKKVDFENYVAENPEFLQLVDEEVEVMPESAKIDLFAPQVEKPSLGGIDISTIKSSVSLTDS